MTAKNISLLIALLLSGCATFTPLTEMLGVDEQPEQVETDKNIKNSSTLASSISFQQQFNQKQPIENSPENLPAAEEVVTTSNTLGSQHNINYYVRGLMQDLVANLQYVNSTTPVAIVSFVMLDSNYNESNLLGIQIAESLMHEVHKFGIPVIDFKTTGYIRITEQGDFAFSKDYQDFSGEMPARYVVGGTMLKLTDGYLVNARIVGMKSQAVVASAQKFIPNRISDPILNIPEIPKTQNLDTTVRLSNITTNLNKASDVEMDSMNQIANIPVTHQVLLTQE